MDEIELLDLLLHRYGSIDTVMSLDLPDGIQLIRKAIEKENESRLFQQWVVQLPYMAMTPDGFISFKDYKDRQTGANIDTRPTEEIMAELDALEASFNTGKER